MKIEIILGDIFDVVCDAIVNPTDLRLSGSGGLDKRIQQMAGEALWKELSELRKMPLKNGAVVTSGYDLPVGNIIHVVSPKFTGEEAYEELKKCYISALSAAGNKNLRTIAIPSIGTGTGGFPLSWPHCKDKIKTTEIVVLETINRYLQNQRWASGVETVKLVLSNEQAYQGYKMAYEWLFGLGINSRSRIRGSLLGGALGDALGYPVEFVGLPQADIRDMILTDGKAIISDDTQMTLFTACGLLLGDTRGHMRGIAGAYYNYINMAYQDWYKTQNNGKGKEQICVSWIRDIPELNVPRAPGITCLSALEKGGGSVSEPINNSKGCGAVMRIAPIPLFFAAQHIGNQLRVAENCAEASAYTHGHLLGWLSSVALGNILFDIMQNFSLRYAVADTVRFLREHYSQYPDVERQIQLLQKAEQLAAMTGSTASFSFVQTLDVIGQLGEGWVGEEALAVGLCCAMSGTGVKRSLCNAVGHKGDSDSTGSIAGQILGAYYGEEVLPADWLEKLELRQVIEEIADDLYEGCKMSEYSEYRDPAWEQKYIQCTIPAVMRPADRCIGWVEETIGTEEIFKPAGYESDPEFCNHPQGWVRFHADGAVEGYYEDNIFRLVPDRAKKQYLILGNFSRNPWIGTITRETGEWGNPMKIEVTGIDPQAFSRIVMDKRFQWDFL